MSEGYTLSKEEFARQESAKGKKWASLDLQILELYRKYVLDEDEPITPEKVCATEQEKIRYAKQRKWQKEHRLDDLFQLLTERHASGVFSIVSYHSKYTSGDELVAMQMGHTAVMELLNKDRTSATVREGITAYIKTIYRNQAREFLRTVYGYACRKEPETGELADPLDPVVQARHPRKTKAAHYTEISLDGMATDSNGNNHQDRQKEIAGNPILDRLKIQERNRRAHEKLTIYYQELLNYPGEPQKPIAVLYARSLYQIEKRFSPDEIEETAHAVMKRKRWHDNENNCICAAVEAQELAVDTSVKWGLQKMGDDKLGVLGERAILSLKKYYDSGLHWGSPYLECLHKPSPYNNHTIWSGLVYTATFSTAKISHWATDIHKEVVKRVSRVLDDPDSANKSIYYEMMCEYFEEGR